MHRIVAHPWQSLLLVVAVIVMFSGLPCALAAEPAKFDAYSETIPGTQTSLSLLPIRGGTFQMGSPAEEADRRKDEGPQVEVRVDDFWMGRTEVTWEQYKHYMAVTDAFTRFDELGVRQATQEDEVDAVTGPSKLYEPTFTFATGEDPQQPALSMTQYAAKQFTKWLSLLTGHFYRLPTEAEWEYACRAGTTTAYSFGNDPAELGEYAAFYDNSDDMLTAKVAERKPNGWGLYDMHGNVAEWTLDQYDGDRYAQLAGQPISAGDAVHWPDTLYPRVVRGGSWDSAASDCRCAARMPSTDQWRSYDPNLPKSPWWLASDLGQSIGFRIVRPRNPPPRDQWNRYWDADVEEILVDVDHRLTEEGKGGRGIVDPGLPQAEKELAGPEH